MSRTESGQFAKGKSGNPAGRPKSASVELRRQLAEHGPALVSKVVELALAGDAQALRICLDRIAPALKPTEALKYKHETDPPRKVRPRTI